MGMDLAWDYPGVYVQVNAFIIYKLYSFIHPPLAGLKPTSTPKSTRLLSCSSTSSASPACQ